MDYKFLRQINIVLTLLLSDSGTHISLHHECIHFIPCISQSRFKNIN